jgi:hypothetical protein
MKKLELNQMEILLGGQIKPKRADDDSGGGSSSGMCLASLGGALIIGTGGIIAAATGGVGGIAFAMAANYWGWGMAAASC